MKKNKTPKPRDPFVVHLQKRPSGVMEKSKKALRREMKIKIMKGDSDE